MKKLILLIAILNFTYAEDFKDLYLDFTLIQLSSSSDVSLLSEHPTFLKNKKNIPGEVIRGVEMKMIKGNAITYSSGVEVPYIVKWNKLSEVRTIKTGILLKACPLDLGIKNEYLTISIKISNFIETTPIEEYPLVYSTFFTETVKIGKDVNIGRFNLLSSDKKSIESYIVKISTRIKE